MEKKDPNVYAAFWEAPARNAPPSGESFKDVITRYPKEKAAIVARQYLDQLRVSG